MNPVTRHLLDRIDDPELADFALAWDALEEIVVEIYRAGAGSEELQDSFEQRRLTCRRLQPRFADALRPHWRAARVDGTPLVEDPFAHVLALPGATAVVENRDLLRILPPAREALNRLLLSRTVD